MPVLQTILLAMLDAILGLAVIASSLFTVLLLCLPSRYGPDESKQPVEQKLKEATVKKEVKVQVLVLGDIGRSPRMQYHALSIAKHGGRVDLVGYLESDPHPNILCNPKISIVPLQLTPSWMRTNNKLLFLFFGPLKALFQTLYLWRVLGYQIEPAEWMLVQNPPSIPTLAIAQIICFLRNTKLIIDWHNFGYSILALKLGVGHPLVQISRFYERLFAKNAYAHLAVTDAMSRVLDRDFQLSSAINTLHDRPPDHFQPILGPDKKLAVLSRLADASPYISKFYTGEMKLIVSSTSWTPDEDFSILLDALVEYSKAIDARQLPKILAIITGKGPLKADYVSKIKFLAESGKLDGVEVKTTWLSMRDYATLLAVADLGVSLHTSSSGVDLPMKVVDMFGAGLPVIGWNDFEAWPELVHEGVNGMGFKSSGELTNALISLFGSDDEQLQRLRRGALEECNRRWDQEWNPTLGRILGLCV